MITPTKYVLKCPAIKPIKLILPTKRTLKAPKPAAKTSIKRRLRFKGVLAQ